MPIIRSKKSKIIVLVITFATLCILLSIFIATFQITLPALAGPFDVGRTSLRWTDTTRDEILTTDPNDHREIVAIVWYPADPAAPCEPVSYLDGFEQLANKINLLYASIARAVQTHSCANARLLSSASPYPVLLFLPGAGANVELYTAQMENLASQGYVVVGIDFPYDVLAVRLSNGEVALQAIDQLPKQDSPTFGEEMVQFYRGRVVNWWTPDTVFVLDQLERLNNGDSSSLFQGRLDLTHIGILGHSIGGIAAAQVCMTDPRIVACLNVDGHASSIPFYFDELGNGPRKPFLLMEDIRIASSDEEQTLITKSREKEANALESLQTTAYRVTLAGATHEGFSDRPFYALSTTPDILRLTDIQRVFVLTFFDRYLRDGNGKLLEEGSPNYPEVTVEKFVP